MRTTVIAVLLTITAVVCYGQNPGSGVIEQRTGIDFQIDLAWDQQEIVPADPLDPLTGRWNDMSTAMNDWARDYFRYGINNLTKQRKARESIRKLMTSSGWVYCSPFCGDDEDKALTTQPCLVDEPTESVSKP